MQEGAIIPQSLGLGGLEWVEMNECLMKVSIIDLKLFLIKQRNPILTVKGLEILFQKLSRTLKDIQKPNHKLLIDAINDFTIMKQLFRQLDGRLANVTTTKLKT